MKADWLKDKKRFFGLFLFGGFVYVLSMRLYHHTEFYYFRDNMHQKNPDFFYGFSGAVLALSSVLFALIGAYYYDRTRNVRQLYLLSSLALILGNLVYMIDYDPYIVIFGNFIIGAGGSCTVAGFAETCQIYEPFELTKIMTYFAASGIIGGIISPCSIYIFNYVDVYIGSWRLNVNNLVALLMVILHSLMFVSMSVFLKNTSKIYNLEKGTSLKLLNEQSDHEEDGLNDFEDKEKSFREKYLSMIGKAIRDKQILSLYFVVLLAVFVDSVLVLLLPIKSSYYLNWIQTDIATANLLAMIVGVIPTLVVVSYLTRRINDMYILYAGFLILILSIAALGVLPVVKDNILLKALFYLNCILREMSRAIIKIIARTLIAVRVDSHIQSVVEAVRFSLDNIANMIASISIELFVLYTNVSLLSLALVVFMTFIYFVINHKQFTIRDERATNDGNITTSGG